MALIVLHVAMATTQGAKSEIKANQCLRKLRTIGISKRGHIKLMINYSKIKTFMTNSPLVSWLCFLDPPLTTYLNVVFEN